MTKFTCVVWMAIISGCVTYQPAELVQAQYKPTKEGVIKMPADDGYQSKERAQLEASAIMKRFCGSDKAVIASLSKDSIPIGSTSSKWGRTTISSTDFKDQTLVHFVCEPWSGSLEINGLEQSSSTQP